MSNSVLHLEHIDKIIFPDFWEESWKIHFVSQLLLIEINDKEIKVLFDGGGFSDRHKTLLKSLNHASSIRKSSSIKRFFVFTGDDLPLGIITPWILFSTVGRREDKEIVLPDPYSFEWNDIGISDFESYRNEMIKFSNLCVSENRVIKQAYWRGSVAQHESRQLFLNLVKDHALFDVQNATNAENFREMKFVGEHAVLVDFPGRGYSARLKHILFSGRPVVVYPRVSWDWVTLNLEPNIHFYLTQMSHVDAANACINLINDSSFGNFFVRNCLDKSNLIEKNVLIAETAKIIERAD